MDSKMAPKFGQNAFKILSKIGPGNGPKTWPEMGPKTPPDQPQGDPKDGPKRAQRETQEFLEFLGLSWGRFGAILGLAGGCLGLS